VIQDRRTSDDVVVLSVYAHGWIDIYNTLNADSSPCKQLISRATCAQTFANVNSYSSVWLRVTRVTKYQNCAASSRTGVLLFFFGPSATRKRGAFEKRREIFRALLQNTSSSLLLKLLTFKLQDALVRGIVYERVQLLSVYGHGAT